MFISIKRSVETIALTFMVFLSFVFKGGGLSVGIVRLQTRGHGVCFVCLFSRNSVLI
jgi:hypothetical protein